MYYIYFKMKLKDNEEFLDTETEIDYARSFIEDNCRIGELDVEYDKYFRESYNTNNIVFRYKADNGLDMVRLHRWFELFDMRDEYIIVISKI